MRCRAEACCSASPTAAPTVSRSQARKSVSAAAPRPLPASSSPRLMRPKAKKSGPREPEAGSSASMRCRTAPLLPPPLSSPSAPASRVMKDTLAGMGEPPRDSSST